MRETAASDRSILLLQHQESAPPALIGDLLRELTYQVTVHRLWADGDPPDPRNFGAVISLGGDMNVGEEAEHPFLFAEREFIVDILEREQPFLGVCLGAQLLATAAGGGVRRRPETQVGWYPLRMRRPDPIVRGFDPLWHVFHWREYACELPPGALSIADFEGDPQVFRIGSQAYGVQFHPEVDRPVLTAWVESDPETVEARWPGGLKKFRKVTRRELYRTVLLCGRLLDNFLGQAGLRSG